MSGCSTLARAARPTSTMSPPAAEAATKASADRRRARAPPRGRPPARDLPRGGRDRLDHGAGRARAADPRHHRPRPPAGGRGGRGGHGGNQRYPDQRDEIAIAKARHADNPNVALWANAGKTIPAEEAIENAAYDLERANRVPSNDTASAPVIKETWIQTDPENFKKRTGVTDKKVIGDDEVDLPASNKDPQSPSSKTDVSTSSRPSEAAPKRSADEISTAPPSPIQSASGKAQEAEKAAEPEAMIAVIVKFALGSSQYATMALRELMKAGGVKTYKPDFSGGR